MNKFSESPKTTAAFGIVALIAGILFLNQTLTGNTIVTNSTSFEIIPIIGVALIFCSLVMAIYTLKQIRK